MVLSVEEAEDTYFLFYKSNHHLNVPTVIGCSYKTMPKTI